MRVVRRGTGEYIVFSWPLDVDILTVNLDARTAERDSFGRLECVCPEYVSSHVVRGKSRGKKESFRLPLYRWHWLWNAVTPRGFQTLVLNVECVFTVNDSQTETNLQITRFPGAGDPIPRALFYLLIYSRVHVCDVRVDF